MEIEGVGVQIITPGMGGIGGTANLLLNSGFDPRVLRPYAVKGPNGQYDYNNGYVTQVDNAGKAHAVPTGNAATLSHEDWVDIDDTAMRVATETLVGVRDLESRGLSEMISGGWGKTLYRNSTMSDITDASLTMDPREVSQGDRPLFDTLDTPLFVAEKDCNIGTRVLAASRSENERGLDLDMIEMSTRKVAELTEKMLVGTVESPQFQSAKFYGYINYTGALTQTITAPTTSGWTGSTLVSEVLSMCKSSKDAHFGGPWVLYYGSDWFTYLGADFKANGSLTLAERVGKIQGISEVKSLPYLTGYKLVLVQMTSNVVKMLVGMKPTVVQWPSPGGFSLNFKVISIMVPLLRKDANDNTGIVYGNTV